MRIQRLHKTFGEFFQDNLEDWIEGFQRDIHPEKEILIWEGMARTFETCTQERKFEPEARQELYLLLLTNTTGGKNDSKHLSGKIIRWASKKHRELAHQVVLERLGKQT